MACKRAVGTLGGRREARTYGLWALSWFLFIVPARSRNLGQSRKMGMLGLTIMRPGRCSVGARQDKRVLRIVLVLLAVETPPRVPRFRAHDRKFLGIFNCEHEKLRFAKRLTR